MKETYANTKRIRIFLPVILWFFYLAGMLSLNGCGSDQGANQAEKVIAPEDIVRQAEENREKWMSEELSLPQEAFYGETLSQNLFTYAADSDGSNRGEESPQIIIYQIDLTKETAAPVEIPLTLPDGQTISKITTDETGTLHLLTLGDLAKRFFDAFWLKIASDGTIISTHAIGDYIEEQESPAPSVGGFAVDAAGNAYLAAGSSLYVFDEGGNLSFKADCDVGPGGYIAGIGPDKAGNIYISGRQDGRMEKLFAVDTAAKSLGPGHDLSALGRVGGLGPGTVGDLVLATENGVFDYEPGQESLTERYKWLDLDLSVDYRDRLFPLADGRILIVDRSSDDYAEKATVRMVRARTAEDNTQTDAARLGATQSDAAQLGAANENPAAEGTGNVTLGIVSNETESYAAEKQAIADFNQANPNSRIELIEYAQDGYEAGLTRLNLDLVSGQGPDMMLMDIGENFPAKLYADMGLFTDLSPLIEADSAIVREDFQENILDIYETDGQLFLLPISYMVSILTGKAAVIGERDAWNLEEMMSFAGEHLDDSLIFDRPTKSAVMELCLTANADAVVDWSGEGNGFNRDLLSKILEFANQFVDEEQFENDPATFEERLNEDQILLMRNRFVPQSAVFDVEIFGAPVSYIGYPSEKGSGMIIGGGTAVAISSQCENRATAWAFITSLLSEEVQATLYPFPLRTSALDARIESAGKSGGTMTEDPQAMAESIQKFREVIDRADQVNIWDAQVLNIITEEAGAYFSGNKPVEETVGIIENRINIYLAEMR